MMPLRYRKPGDQLAVIADQEGCSTVNSKRRKLRLAIAVIYFTRVLVSLSKKVLDPKNRLLLRSLSYISVDIAGEKPSSDDRNPFLNIDKRFLIDLVRNKSFESLNQLGGVQQVAVILETNAKRGIGSNKVDLARRIEVFGANRYQKQPAKRFLSFVIEALKDPTIIILVVCAIFSLAFGIKQHKLKDGWYDGGSIILAVFLVVIVSAVSNFKQNRQFEKLSDESSDIKVEVVRDGRRVFVSIFEILVGDLVCLKIGDQIPADGLFSEGHSLKVDESSMTGESDHVEINESENPFLLSGTKVTDGYGTMLVTSVGMNTAWGEMMSSIIRESDEETPLQARLNKLTSSIGKIGLAVAAAVLVALLVRYFTGNTKDGGGNKEFNGNKTKFDDVMNSVMDIVAAAVTIIVVAIPEGLPLAVTLTLAYSMKRMMADHAMVRKLSACETMGSATTICTDKTGTLTLNEMKVTEVWLGTETTEVSFPLEIADNVYELLQEDIGLNTTGDVYKPDFASSPEISGSPTEKAILSWAVLDLGMNINEPKENCDVLHVETFNSEKKMSGVLMMRKSQKAIHTHWKGAAERILDMCSHYYVRSGAMKAVDDAERLHISMIIKNMAAKSLRCIAFAHTEVADKNEQAAHGKLEESELTLIGLVGLKDPCRPGVKTAVESCINASVNIKMITGDNVHTAKAIAIECGILNANEDLNDETVVEGEQFRNYSPEERMEKIDKIRVMARSSPFDKLLMVQSLKQKGQVVAVTGDGTNDAPALKEADIGLSMGIQGK